MSNSYICLLLSCKNCWNTSLNAVYKITPEDTVAGGVAFIIKTAPTQYCASISDKVVFNITPAPKVEAGLPQLVCADTAGIYLNGMVMHAQGGVWSTLGTGSFSENNQLETRYIPSVSDTANQNVQLTKL